MEKLLNTGHVVYTDRYYTSIPLADALTSQGTGLVGTLVKNRKDLPQEVRATNFRTATNEVKAWRSDAGLVVA